VYVRGGGEGRGFSQGGAQGGSEAIARSTFNRSLEHVRGVQGRTESLKTLGGKAPIVVLAALNNSDERKKRKGKEGKKSVMTRENGMRRRPWQEGIFAAENLLSLQGKTAPSKKKKQRVRGAS